MQAVYDIFSNSTLTNLQSFVILNELCEQRKCGSVGTGRRARLRILWQQCRVGSSPIFRIFFTLEEANKMDLIPFLEIDLLNLQNSQILQLQKFSKENFDKTDIFSTAEELKYSSLIKSAIQNEIDNPSPEFVKYIVTGIYDGKKNQAKKIFFCTNK